jgi:hypothetical protein
MVRVVKGLQEWLSYTTLGRQLPKSSGHSTGSVFIHSDTWSGSAAQLAERGLIGIYPVVGWWRERRDLGRWDKSARYSLIVSIFTPVTEIDIYTPVAVELGVQVGVMT